MIDCLILFSKTGSVQYIYNGKDDGDASSTMLKTHFKNIDKLIQSNRLDAAGGNGNAKKSANVSPYILEWDTYKHYVAVAVYKEVLATYGLRRIQFVKTLLVKCLEEFSVFYEACGVDEYSSMASLALSKDKIEQYDRTFRVLLKLTSSAASFASSESLSSMQGGQSADGMIMNGSDEMESKAKTKKKQTVWHGKGKVTKEAMAMLDKSKDKYGNGQNSEDADSRALAEARAAYLPDADDDEQPSWAETDELNDEAAENEAGGWGQSLKGLFDQMAGNKYITENDADTVLKVMEEKLVSKNVGQSCAREICMGVKSKIVGKRLASFGRVKSVVRTALESSITRILTPHRSVDILRDIKAKNSGMLTRSFRPYVIVMVGINGVGKSTSLAKITYYLKNNGCRPLLAACDTFRAGAVEQLSVHAKCLDVPIFAKGYARDASNVAKGAIQEAIKQKNDVVLVDTAGRMQNNVPLMNALSKLVNENNPDLVCFVGEALVGNDGIDQLTMFDNALRNGSNNRHVDGIVLTKFDTVSDKVGAALSMSHITGQPVLFVGTGQKYNHLKKLSAPAIIKNLFS